MGMMKLNKKMSCCKPIRNSQESGHDSAVINLEVLFGNTEVYEEYCVILPTTLSRLVVITSSITALYLP
jgi:hypothetical protein